MSQTLAHAERDKLELTTMNPPGVRSNCEASYALTPPPDVYMVAWIDGSEIVAGDQRRFALANCSEVSGSRCAA